MGHNGFKKEDLELAKQTWEEIPIPKEGREKMEQRIQQAKMKKKHGMKGWQKGLIYAAAAFAICFIVVNTSSQAAQAMGKLPVVGTMFRVITVRKYDWASEDGKTSVQVDVPEITAVEEGTVTPDDINVEIKKYIDDVQMEYAQEHPEGYGSLEVSYEVITDSEKYLCVDIWGVETGASGYEFHKYVTIDKTTGKKVALADLFPEGADYITPLSEEIIRQMHADTETPYFIAADGEPEGFEKISAEQNFYLTEQGQLMIVFNEYEVGPGSIGAPGFLIPDDVIKGIK